MQKLLSIALAASVLAASTHWLSADENWTAWRELEGSVERLRPFVASAEFASGVDADARTCLDRLAEIDATLEARASRSDGIGAAWMWTPAHREELFSLARDVSPSLDELAHLARSRQGSSPIPVPAGLGVSRHRTNLFCVAALVATDDLVARERFRQAWEVATMEDDGGSWSLHMQLASAGIIAQAIRQRFSRLGRVDATLVKNLGSDFERRFSCDLDLMRVARDLVYIVDQEGRPALDARTLSSLVRDSQEIHAVLAGSIPRGEFLARRQAAQRFWIGMLCSPDMLVAVPRNLQL